MYYRSGSVVINLDNVASAEPFDSDSSSRSGVVISFVHGGSIQLDASLDEFWSVVGPVPVELPTPMKDGESPEEYLNRILQEQHD